MACFVWARRVLNGQKRRFPARAVADFHGALKGLPPNARANSLCDACGLEYKVRGDVFIGQLHMGGLGLQLGDAPPQVAMDPAWM